MREALRLGQAAHTPLGAVPRSSHTSVRAGEVRRLLTLSTTSSRSWWCSQSRQSLRVDQLLITRCMLGSDARDEGLTGYVACLLEGACPELHQKLLQLRFPASVDVTRH